MRDETIGPKEAIEVRDKTEFEAAWDALADEIERIEQTADGLGDQLSGACRESDPRMADGGQPEPVSGASHIVRALHEQVRKCQRIREGLQSLRNRLEI